MRPVRRFMTGKSLLSALEDLCAYPDGDNSRGALAEFFYTRERVTEESMSSDEARRKALSVSEQAVICFKDRFWWIMMAFLLLYQMGGMLKNVSQLYFCQAMFPDGQGNYTTAWGGRIQGMLAIRAAMPWIFISGETIPASAAVFVLFLFMKS